MASDWPSLDMVVSSFWLCFVIWIAQAVSSSGYNSICDLDPCTCDRGKIQCDCSRSPIKEIVLEAGILQDILTNSISVANCVHMHVTSRAVTGLPVLQQVSVANIASLTLEEQAFSWSTKDSRHTGLVISISRCVIPEIPSHTFRGSLRDILLTEVNISHIRPFAFAAIDHAEKLQFTRVHFAEVDSQAFKKFAANFLMFIDSKIDVFRTRTMINVDVHQEVRLQNITFGRIESAALKMQSVQSFKLVKSTVDHVEHNAFHVLTKGDVSIHDNTFGHVEREAFLGITVDSRYLRDAGKQDLIFENNTLVHPESAALAFNTTGFDSRLDLIRLRQPCSCANVESWSNDLVVYYSYINFSAVNVNSVLYCLDPKPVSVKDYQTRICIVSKLNLVIKIVLIVGLIFVLVAGGTFLYCTVKKKGKRYINVSQSQSPKPKPADSSKAHILVVPDGKTYRETELHVIVEHVEPILSTEYVKDQLEGSD